MSPRFLLLLIFTLSGFSGLIYESIWTHYLKLLLGHSAYAQTLVLSIFLGGLGVGSWLSSKFLVQIRNPLIAYVCAEVFLGICGLSFHGIFRTAADTFYTYAATGADPVTIELVKWSVATILITPQAIVLGMTFPWVSAALIRLAPESTGYSVSMLYFTNSIGGAIGVLVSGFLLISWVGLPGTVLTAACINIVIAVLVWPITKNPRLGKPVTVEIQGQPDATWRSGHALLAIAALTGLASFYYEIAWIRMLSLVLSSSIHSFELMLSAFITGLALGGLWIRKRIDTLPDLISTLGYVQLLMGLFAVLTLPLYILSFDIMGGLIRVAPKNEIGYTMFTLVSHLICLAVMLPATFMAGMTLPLISKLMINGPLGEKAVGYVYAFNMVGGILGVVTAVHVLIVAIGVKYLIVAGALVDIALGCWLLLPSRQTKRLLTIATIFGLVAITVSLQRFSPKIMASGVFRHGASSLAEDTEVRYYKDGKTASVAVTQHETRLSIITNGKSDGAVNTAPDQFAVDEPTMTMAGVLPLAINPDATRIANIGFGTGITTHTVLGSRRVQHVDTIEIEPRMVEAARHFGDYNTRAYEDQRSQVHIDDAKSFFARHNRQYDVIISEPSNPWVSGIANLFSDEFYRHTRPYLANNGIFVQWLQLYEINITQVGSVIKAIHNNFAYFKIYNSYDGDMIIIAGNQPIAPLDPWIFQEPQLKESLSRVNISNLYELQIRELGDESTLAPAFMRAQGPMNSDYFPYLAFSAPKSMFLHVEAHPYFSELRYAPLPILPVMNGLDLREMNPEREGHHFLYYREYRDANATVRLIQETRDSYLPMLANDHLVNRVLTMLRVECTPSLESVELLYGLAKRINPYLPMTKTLPLWNELEDTCTAEIHSDWISLHKSITERNYDVMASMSHSLITSGEYDAHDELWNYLWTSYLLANYKLEAWAPALEFAAMHDLTPDTRMAFLFSNLYQRLVEQNQEP